MTIGITLVVPSRASCFKPDASIATYDITIIVSLPGNVMSCHRNEDVKLSISNDIHIWKVQAHSNLALDDILLFPCLMGA